MNTYPDTLAAVFVHIGDDGYDIPWGDDRADFFDVTGIPSLKYDGIITAPGSTSYETRFLDRQAVTTDVTIKLTGGLVADRTYEATAEVCVEASGEAKNMRIYMIQVLDHWPTTHDYYRNCLMQAADTLDVSLLPGVCTQVTRAFTFNDDSWANQEDIKIIAWAEEPLDHFPAEVFQAAEMPWPFPKGMEWVTVGDPGNSGELSGEGAGGTGPDRICGAVDYEYRIGKYEVTNAQYIEFLNAVATTDTHGLYSASMSTGMAGGIDRAGTSGSYTYAPRDGNANWLNRPVNYVNWYDALRFANWMHNGRPTGAQDGSTTEDGVYDLSLGAGAVRKPGAVVFIPTEDEWYKAAYYKGGGTSAGYWDYPTQSDALPTGEAPPGTDITNGSANFYYYDTYVDPTYYTTEVGAYTYKPSDGAYGTFDQGGNVFEFNDGLIDDRRVMRGSSYDGAPNFLRADFRLSSDPYIGATYLGFRLASFEDCDGNRIPDVCDWDCDAMGGLCTFTGCGLAADCNTDGVIDICEVARGASPDCMRNGIPNECDVRDCAGELWCADCDTNGVPDGCQPDCTFDGIPDVCHIRDCPAEDKSCWDCNANTVPDGCDLDGDDPDGNGQVSPDCNTNDVPDECDEGTPALPPDPTHRAPKNRYLSIDPTTSATSPVALQVSVASMMRCSGDDRRACTVNADCPKVCNNNKNLQCEFNAMCGGGTCITTSPCVPHPDAGVCSFDGEPCVDASDCAEPPLQTCVHATKWVDEPYQRSCSPLDDCADQWFADLVDAPVYHVWTENQVHVIGCEIIPAAVYDVRSTACGVTFSDPLTIGTITKPQVHYGDCVGPVVGGAYTPADGFTNVTDVQAYLRAAGGLEGAPPTTWVDVHGVVIGSPCLGGDCIVPQQILNVGDLQTIKFGFLGQMYVETPGQENPGDCP